jgi:hypothetical protein
LADDRSGIVRKYARHRWEVADVSIDDSEERGDGGLVGGDGIEVEQSRRYSLCERVTLTKVVIRQLAPDE